MGEFLDSTPDPMATTMDKLETWQNQMIPYLTGQIQTPGKAPTTITRLGIHWIPANVRASDISYMTTLRPGAIKVISLDPARYKQALACLDPSPDSVILARDHPLSEQKAAMKADPVGTGHAHALAWRQKFEPGGALHDIDPKKLLFCSVNEPPVENEADEGIVATYSEVYMTDMYDYGFRSAIFHFSSGWLRNADTAAVKNTKPIWKTFRRLEPLIVKTGSVVTLNEYWRNDPDEGWYQAPDGQKWGWNAFRHYACELCVPLLIGECGLTKEINGVPAPGQSKGWVGNISPSAYAEQLWRYADKCHPNVMAVLPFTTNYESDDWKTDDTAGAHADILARKHAYAWPAGVWPVAVVVSPVVVTPPVVVPPVAQPWQAGDTVKALTTVNIRSTPGYTGKVVGKLATGATALLTGGPQTVDKLVWWQTAAGWLAQAVDGETLLAKTLDLHYPFKGIYYITQIYGVNAAAYAKFGLKGHNGIDYGLPVGTPLFAASDGVVREAENDPGGFGLYVKIAHAWGETICAHMSRQDVANGQTLKQGAPLGLSGNTGNSTGAHLHFGLRISGYSRADGWQGYCDPAPYLPKMG